MTAVVKRAAGELFGLFVDDGGLAAFAVAWVLAVALGVPRVVGAQGWVAPLLFAGLAALLVGSAVRRARRAPP